ncbi:acyltransferase [Flavobacterium sp.]|uniref:acyltransferase family protein n=1 Tax=Flavobacterium sp. TaxID=239 RepID=UPI0028BE4BBD|nr:acyltransferase [Flavobacterium sp.]
MNGTPRNTSNRIFGLDVLRAGSIMMVLFSHSSVIYPESHGVLSKLKDLSGFFGIELFFGLSGFLIGSSMFKLFVYGEYRFRDVKDFLLRRLFRILPSYYLVLLINLGIFLWFSFSIDEIWKYFLLLQNINRPIPAFFPESWSLPVKEIGYVIALALLLLVLLIFSRLSRKKLFFIVIAFLISISFLAKIYYHFNSDNLSLAVWSQSVRSVVLYRLDSVLFGVLFGCFYLEFPAFFKNHRLLFVVLGFLFFVLFILGLAYFGLRLENAAWFWNVFVLPFASLIVLLFFPMLLHWEKGSIVLEKPVKFFCDISYSVYLIHYSIVLFLLMQIFDLKSFSSLELNLFTFGYLALTIGLSYLFYRYFEKPINSYRLSTYKL